MCHNYSRRVVHQREFYSRIDRPYCGLRAIDRRLKHARSDLDKDKRLRNRRRAMTVYIYLDKDKRLSRCKLTE